MVKTFLHSGKLGDIIWALPVIKYLGGGKLYIKPNEWDGAELKLSLESALSIISLLNEQEYIHGAEMYGGQRIDYDLNQFRNVIFRYPGITISQSVFLGLGITDNVSEYLNTPWLKVDKDPNVIDKIVVSRTGRYLSGREHINKFYLILKERGLSKHGVFVGSESEYESFENIYKTEIPYYKTSSILDLAKVVSASKFYVGNENLTNAINEGLKKVSFLERNLNPPAQSFCIFNRPDQFII